MGNDCPNILTLEIGPVIGSHVGPGMIAIIFYSKDRINK